MENNTDIFSLLNAASYANGYNPLISWSKGIAYRPNSLRYANRNHFSNCGEEFLINSYSTRFDIENQGSIEQYTSDSELMMLSMMDYRDRFSRKKITLPDSIALDLSLGDCLLRRRSVRTYTGDVISLHHLSTVLRAAYGVTSESFVRSNTGKFIPLKLRTVASGGGLYPVTLLIVSLNIDKLAKGIFEYSPEDDALYECYNENFLDEMLKTYAISDEILSLSRANYICLLVASPWKSMRKYGNKGLRFVLQEIGAISQNIHLTNVSLGLGSTDCAAFYENEINNFFNFDGVNQSVLHSIVSGIFE